MKIPFRQHHLIQLLNEYQAQAMPLDILMYHYFKSHKSLGPKDRGEISEKVYHLIRWQGLIDHLCEKPITWEKRLAISEQIDPMRYLEDPSIPLHVRLSCPKSLFNLLINTYGEQKTRELCLTLNTPAPTMVRINPLKTTREDILKLWKDQYQVSPSIQSPFGIQFHKKIAFFTLPEFKEGLFEVQDEGSQLLADLVDPQPGDQVFDYCAGSGGKTLAFAYKMQHRGQCYLHDIRISALHEAKKRLNRAGIQNAQTVKPDSPTISKLKGKMDWVLVDAPCSGTGTLRRNPDMKWKFSVEMVERLVEEQKVIFERALQLLKPTGKIVYGTCSILPQENEQQVEYFIKTHALEQVRPDFHPLPTKGGMDGFYGAVLKRTAQ